MSDREHDEREQRAARMHRVPSAIARISHFSVTINSYVRHYVDGQIGYLEMLEEVTVALAMKNDDLLGQIGLLKSTAHPPIIVNTDDSNRRHGIITMELRPVKNNAAAQPQEEKP